MISSAFEEFKNSEEFLRKVEALESADSKQNESRARKNLNSLVKESKESGDLFVQKLGVATVVGAGLIASIAIPTTAPVFGGLFLISALKNVLKANED